MDTVVVPPRTDQSVAPARTDVWWLALAFGLLFFIGLGNRPLANPDEPRYAEIPREMIATGDWVLPRLNDTLYFEKPPLVYWVVAVCRMVFGPGEWSMRFPSAAFALAGVLLTYATARSLYGRNAGIAAAVVLGTCGLFFVLGQLLLLDMAVSVLMTATLCCFILGVRTEAGPRRRALFYGLYASAALATLTKGLIGFLIPGAVMFLWLLVFNQWRRLRPLYLPSGVALFLLIAAPWHVLAAQRHPGWADFYFVREHWQRFTTTVHERYAPWWFFIPAVVLGLFPWVGFLFAAVPEAIGATFSSGLRAMWGRRQQHAEAWFFLTWAGFVFLFFSKSQSKLIPYILPVFPPLAVLLGLWLARRYAENNVARLRLGLGIFSFACGLLAMAMVVLVFRPGMIRNTEQAEALRPFAVALAAVLLLGGVAAPWAAKVRSVAAGLTTLVATALGFYLVVLSAAPVLQRPSTKSLALVVRERGQPADRVYHYWAFFHDFVYYSERPVGLVSYLDELEVQFVTPTERAERFIDDAELRRRWAGPGRLWVVVRKRDQANPRSVFADAAFRYHLIAETRSHSLLSNLP